MSTAGISSSSLVQGAQYFSDRKNDLQQLGAALQSGDLAGAQQDFAQIQTLAANGPFSNGNAFFVAGRQQDFTAIGQALQSGDIAGAQQALTQLQSTFTQGGGGGTTGPVLDPGPAVIINLTTGGVAPTTTTTAPATTTTPTTNTTDPATTSTAASSTGPEIVLNIGGGNAGSTPEEITLSFSNTGSGGEQLTIGVGSQQNPNTQEVTLNLPQNGSEQIILNLLNNGSVSSPSPTSTSSSASASTSSGVNVVA
jgi:hypothetical protein